MKRARSTTSRSERDGSVPPTKKRRQTDVRNLDSASMNSKVVESRLSEKTVFSDSETDVGMLDDATKELWIRRKVDSRIAREIQQQYMINIEKHQEQRLKFENMFKSLDLSDDNSLSLKIQAMNSFWLHCASKIFSESGFNFPADFSFQQLFDQSKSLEEVVESLFVFKSAVDTADGVEGLDMVRGGMVSRDSVVVESLNHDKHCPATVATAKHGSLPIDMEFLDDIPLMNFVQVRRSLPPPDVSSRGQLAALPSKHARESAKLREFEYPREEHLLFRKLMSSSCLIEDKRSWPNDAEAPCLEDDANSSDLDILPTAFNSLPAQAGLAGEAGASSDGLALSEEFEIRPTLALRASGEHEIEDLSTQPALLPQSLSLGNCATLIAARCAWRQLFEHCDTADTFDEDKIPHELNSDSAFALAVEGERFIDTLLRHLFIVMSRLTAGDEADPLSNSVAQGRRSVESVMAMAETLPLDLLISSSSMEAAKLRVDYLCSRIVFKAPTVTSSSIPAVAKKCGTFSK